MTPFAARATWFAAIHFLISATAGGLLLVDGLGCCRGPLFSEASRNAISLVTRVLAGPFSLVSEANFLPSLPSVIWAFAYILWSFGVGLGGAWILGLISRLNPTEKTSK